VPEDIGVTTVALLNMGFINFILNIAALLLWLGWCDKRRDTLTGNPTIALARTLRPLGKAHSSRWKYLGCLVALLLLRPLFYNWIGPVVKWTPHLSLGVIAPSFLSDHYSTMALFSGLSFLLALANFYILLIFFSAVNHSFTEPSPFQKLVQSHLGWVIRLPIVLRLVVPLIIITIVWIGMSPLLAGWGIIPPAPVLGIRFRQGLLVGAGAYLFLQHVLAFVLLVHFLNSYLYIGEHAALRFTAQTAQRVLRFVSWLPLRVGRMDFAPVFMIVLVYLLATILENWLPRIYPT